MSPSLPSRRFALALVLLLATAPCLAAPQAAEPKTTNSATALPKTTPPKNAPAPAPALPPLPEGVTELRFHEIFAPVGPRGLDYTEKAKALDGKRVRILGFMVKTCRHDHGRFLLTPTPIALHDHEMGPADDLPPSTVFVDVAPLRRALKYVPHEPGLFLLTGTLSLGGRDELHGRRSWVRLQLERPVATDPVAATPATSPTPSVREQVRASDTAPADAVDAGKPTSLVPVARPAVIPPRPDHHP